MRNKVDKYFTNLFYHPICLLCFTFFYIFDDSVDMRFYKVLKFYSSFTNFTASLGSNCIYSFYFFSILLRDKFLRLTIYDLPQFSYLRVETRSRWWFPITTGFTIQFGGGKIYKHFFTNALQFKRFNIILYSIQRSSVLLN